MTVTRFSDEDEAVSIVNESDYGLTTAIYTADTTRGFRVARRIDVGMVFINNYFRGVIGTPFGGTKYSGYGREHAIETLREFSLHEDGPLPVRTRNHPELAGSRRHLRRRGLTSSYPNRPEPEAVLVLCRPGRASFMSFSFTPIASNVTRK